MVAEFSLIVIEGGAATHDRQELMNFLYAVLKYLDGTEVLPDEFDASYDMIPRVVVQHSQSLKDIEEKIARGEETARDVKTKAFSKENFTGHLTGQKTIDLRKKADPRYGIIDAHVVDAGIGDMVVLNIAVNTMTDARVKTWMNIGLARKLNVGRSHDVVAVVTDPTSGKQIEFFEIASLQQRQSGRSITGDGTSGALNEYKSKTGINIGNVVKAIDRNVNIKDAPTTLRQVDRLLAKMKESIGFMEKGGFDRLSIDEGKKEMNEILSVREMYASLIGTESTMISIYFKMNSPDRVRELISTAEAEKKLDVENIKDINDE